MPEPCKPWPQAPRKATKEVPSWADPRALMAVAAVRFREYEAPQAGTFVIAPADPMRIAIGFAGKVTTSSDGYVSPGADPNNYRWPVNYQFPPLWFDLFTYGPLVTLEWNLLVTFTHSFGVWEVYRLP